MHTVGYLCHSKYLGGFYYVQSESNAKLMRQRIGRSNHYTDPSTDSFSIYLAIGKLMLFFPVTCLYM